MRKNKASFKDTIKLLALNIIPSLAAAIIVEIVKLYIHINEWLNKYDLIMYLLILIPVFAVSIALVILALLLLRGKGRNKNYPLALPPILFFCTTLLIFNGLHIAINLSQSVEMPQQRELIAHQEINFEILLERRTIDIPIKDPYSALILEIKCPQGEGLSQFPELELEKISPLTGDWEILVEGDTTEKLIINGLEAAKEDEYYYHPRSGKFEVQDIEEREVSLDSQNKIRLNVRNFAGFKETIELIFYGL